MNTTLNRLKDHNPTCEGWGKLLASLGKTQADDEELSILTILEKNGLDDAHWSLRGVTGKDREIKAHAVWCAQQVVHLMDDQRSINSIGVCEKFTSELATQQELVTATCRAWDASRESRGSTAWTQATDAEKTASYAAWAASYAARAVQRSAPGTAAIAAARAASYAAWAGTKAKDHAVWDTETRDAYDAVRLAQTNKLIEICTAVEQPVN